MSQKLNKNGKIQFETQENSKKHFQKALLQTSFGPSEKITICT